MARYLPRAPEELTAGRLKRLGEGMGKVVYASEHWVVQRPRSPREILALIVLWRSLRRIEHALPFGLGRFLLRHPSPQLRLLRVLTQMVMMLGPRALWPLTHAREMLRTYLRRARRGEKLAQTYLTETMLVPERIEFPPTKVRVGGWPGWLIVSEATERVESTLYERLADLAREGRFEEVEHWLGLFLELRRAGWRRGLFSLDAHLKNFGVVGDRVVLLDSGGLTDDWQEVSRQLEVEEVMAEPHIRLGLGRILATRPDIAARFNERWKAMVNRESVSGHWPAGTG
jgi:hypothetical protein